MEVEDDSRLILAGVPEKFTYAELSQSTGGFSHSSILGNGGFGVVYEGTLKWGSKVAIKRMNRDATWSHQGMKEFKSEVVIVSQVSHRNLIKLRGYCDDPGRREYMLVYDLMPNGSLDDVLFKRPKGITSLSWPQKVKILEGTADGLDYLHRGLAQQVIHRDVKCSNILLDNEWNAKLGDFGIARLVDHQGRPATTLMAGTIGYIAPEVFTEQQFSDKADVFAFGVVCLELACGRRVLAEAPRDVGLVQMVRRAHREGHLLSTVDKRLGEYDTSQMEMVLKVGLSCTQTNPRYRPSMKVVAQILAGDVKVPCILSPGQWFLRAWSALFKKAKKFELLAANNIEEDRKGAAKNEENERDENMAAKRAKEVKMLAKKVERKSIAEEVKMLAKKVERKSIAANRQLGRKMASKNKDEDSRKLEGFHHPGLILAPGVLEAMLSSSQAQDGVNMR